MSENFENGLNFRYEGFMEEDKIKTFGKGLENAKLKSGRRARLKNNKMRSGLQTHWL